MMSMMTQKNRLTLKQRCEQELRTIQRDNGNILYPRDVVRFARKHEKSALHSQFTWDVDKAAEAYWLAQARHVIKVHVVIHADIEDPIQVWVSLTDDRVNDGGYRLVTDVMSESQRRAQLLHQALRSHKLWRERYATLSELAKIFEAADDVDTDNGRDA